MSDSNLYGLCELARELDLPESTTRYYRDVFSQYVQSVGMGRRRRYTEEALTTLRFIAAAFEQGQTREEIARTLAVRVESHHDGLEADDSVADAPRSRPEQMQVMTSLIDGEREQRELMWQMIRELSRFGDAIERQHYILSELVEHIFRSADRRLPVGGDGDGLEGIVDAEVVSEAEHAVEDEPDRGSNASRSDVEALRKALESERDLVERLRQSKLDLERRAAAAEAKLELTLEQEPSLLRRLFDRKRGR